MYLCYLDESGTSDIPGNTSHFILAGLAIPADRWKDCDNAIFNLKKKWSLIDTEIHTAWLLRPYIEQTKITDFEKLNYKQRKSAVDTYRKQELYRLQKIGKTTYHRIKKNFRKTNDYVHLTLNERRTVISEFTEIIQSWGFARLFAECIDKVHFDPTRTNVTVDEQAFEQVVSRFEHFLQIISKSESDIVMGMLIHDNNETLAKKLTNLMQTFHKKGTLWTRIKNIIETPLFVDSQLTCMVQAADVCSYSLRRYLENGEEGFFNNIFDRADRKDNKVVGVRHFARDDCDCMICKQD
ncbi:DUF3800 domain-containing protein [bacterium]|nr:DUF3800 domain-containing protein [bacterium]